MIYLADADKSKGFQITKQVALVVKAKKHCV